MSMNQREKTFVSIGGIVIIAVIVFIGARQLRARGLDFGVGGGTEHADFKRMAEQLEVRDARFRDLAKYQKELNASIPVGGADEQVHSFLKRIEQTSNRLKVEIPSIIPRDTSRRGKSEPGAGDKMSYVMHLETGLKGLVGFLVALEEFEQPVIFESIDIKADANKPDELKVTLELYSYIFEGREL